MRCFSKRTRFLIIVERDLCAKSRAVGKRERRHTQHWQERAWFVTRLNVRYILL